MTQRLHLVFGGELVSPDKSVFKDPGQIHVVGMFPDYATAHAAWKAEAQRTVDNAHMRYFIAHIHRLRDEERSGSPTEKARLNVTRTIRHAINELASRAPELAAHLDQSIVTGVSCCYEPAVDIAWTT